MRGLVLPVPMHFFNLLSEKVSVIVSVSGDALQLGVGVISQRWVVGEAVEKVLDPSERVLSVGATHAEGV